MFADNQKRMGRRILCMRIICNHSYNLIILINIHTTYTGCRPSESPCIAFIETAAASLTPCKEDLTLSVCQNCIQEFVSIPHSYGDDSVCPWS